MERKEFLKKLFECAKDAGFEAYEAYFASGDSFSCEVFGGEVVDYSVSNTSGLSFRALIGGRMGYASTQAYDDDAIDMLIEGVRKNASVIETDDEEFIYEGSASYETIDAYNPAIDAVPASQRIEYAKAAEQTVLNKDPRVTQVEGAAYFSDSDEIRIVNSEGLDLSFRSNCYGAYTAPVAKDGEKTGIGMGIFFSRDPSALDIEAIGKKALDDALFTLDAESVPSGEYKVAFLNKTAATLLATFTGVFNAKSAQKGLSLLKDKEGTVIASPAVTLVDDPHGTVGLASRPFDDEGVATYKKNVIDGGTLTTLLHNLKTAKKQGVETTANACKGGYAAPVGIAPTNFYFAPGAVSFDELLKTMGDGLVITELQGMHSGANQISGDFSLSAKGYRVENGVKGRPVNQITVAGNFYQLLKDIVLFADDLEFRMPGASSFGSPTFLLNKMSVAGK